jgi:hypothetical protein
MLSHLVDGIVIHRTTVLGISLDTVIGLAGGVGLLCGRCALGRRSVGRLAAFTACFCCRALSCRVLAGSRAFNLGGVVGSSLVARFRRGRGRRSRSLPACPLHAGSVRASYRRSFVRRGRSCRGLSAGRACPATADYMRSGPGY